MKNLLLLLTLLLAVPATAAEKKMIMPPWTNGMPKWKVIVAPRVEPTVPPPLPMKTWFTNEVTDFGKYQFTAGALQPANQALTFEKSGIVQGGYDHLITWGATPMAQEAYISYYTYDERNFVRARAFFENRQTPGTLGTNLPPIALIKSMSMDGFVAWRMPVGAWNSRAIPRPPGSVPHTPPPVPQTNELFITTKSVFISICPYCGTRCLSRQVSQSGGTSQKDGSTLQHWAISFKCRNCKMQFADSRTQVMPDTRSIRLPTEWERRAHILNVTRTAAERFAERRLKLRR